MVINVNPEFGVELSLAIPYAYHLHLKNKLDGVITSKGMRAYYYFCKNVQEFYTHRSLNNNSSLKGIPNKWTHHNALAITGKDYDELTEEEKIEVNGVLDYREWEAPPYKEYYKNDEFKFKTPTVFITNKYNIEHGHDPRGFFDIKCLYEIFCYLKLKNYTVIYKRATNREKEFSIDPNEYHSLTNGFTDIKADVTDVGTITDFQLTKYFDNVVCIDDLINKSNYGYNETQLKIMANCDRFISVCGGNAILSSLFGGKTLIYVHTGRELRPNYFGKNSYFRKLSNSEIIPIIDRRVMKTGIPDYSELLDKIKENF
jgi:hypothetical protein